MEQPHGFIALHVAEPVRVVVGHEKHAVLLPFEALFRSVFTRPDRRQSAAFHHVNNFIQGTLQRRQGFSSGRGRVYGYGRRSLCLSYLKRAGGLGC